LLYSADGNYEVTLMTKATLKYTGEVFWKPPAIYKSSCEINVEYFPFDEQSCIMKFGSWTYNGAQVIIIYIHVQAMYITQYSRITEFSFNQILWLIYQLLFKENIDASNNYVDIDNKNFYETNFIKIKITKLYFLVTLK